jgi:CRP/FNR family transcriptional regulator, anaerobic regulatory protein
MRESSMFADLTDEDYGLIHLPIDDMEFPTGTTLFQEKDEARHLYSIRQGLIKLTRVNPHGLQRILRILRPGDVIGLEALVTGHYEYDAITLNPVRTCRVPVEVIQRLDRESPRLHKKLMEKWYKTLAEADEWMTELTSGSARSRLAKLLLKMRNPTHPELSTLFSRDDIGSMLCMTMETASRTINAFQREGKVIQLDAGGRFYQIDARLLEAEISDPV